MPEKRFIWPLLGILKHLLPRLLEPSLPLNTNMRPDTHSYVQAPLLYS
uniref:Uncharacterized protein n=1 Tax=Glycine max TaxID=3847 RepID=C6T6J0_SOYBN|nr:unknown [Glycine max]